MDQTQSRTVVRMLDRIHADSRLNKTGFVMAAPHCHPHCELFYIENGEGSFFIDNNMYELHTGDFLFIPPQVFHYTRYTRSACKRSNVFFRTGDIAGDIAAAMPHGAGHARKRSRRDIRLRDDLRVRFAFDQQFRRRRALRHLLHFLVGAKVGKQFFHVLLVGNAAQAPVQVVIHLVFVCFETDFFFYLCHIPVILHHHFKFVKCFCHTLRA